MNPLLELADRVEAATEPDRQLDFSIQRIVRDKPKLVFGLDACPTYTVSLDAATTLVPEGHTVQLSDWDHELLRKKGAWQAIVLPFGARGAMAEYTFSNRCDHAATPALALTAASLRAIASMGSGR